ncbi:MAG: low molecular weight phosphatase family protein [Cytophagaceae bacterium]
MKELISFYSPLQAYIKNVLNSTNKISGDRKGELEGLGKYVAAKIHVGGFVNLNFICTHNSRRSHLSQIWAGTAAAFYKLENIHTFSGGTEATAFNPRAVAAIQRAGFKVKNPGGANPVYLISFGEKEPAMECFSKKYNDLFNPQEDFVAVMTCSEADRDCPFIPGASLRVPIRYKDPKEADNTLQETERYDDRCFQIATEMFYLMDKVKNG